MLTRVVLLAALGFIGYRFFLRRHKLPVNIIVLFAFLAVGAFMVIFPETSNDIAHFFGVGRGADLISYVYQVAVLYVLLHYYTKFVETENELTRVVRELAILRAELHERTGGERPSGERPPTSVT